MFGFQKRSSRPQAHPQKLADGGEVRGNKQSSPPDPEASGLGFGHGSRAAALLAQATGSGPIRGPGTGTSDSIKTAVEQGSFIVPADSVAQIGEQNLAALGFRSGMNPADRPKAPGLGLGFQPDYMRNVPAPAAGQGFGFQPRSQRQAAQAESKPEPGIGFKSKAQRENGQGASANAVPVNLSNGEFQVSPEQLQAIGARVLEQLKNATHTPVQEQRSTDALYFVNGGVVEDDRARLQSPSTGNNPVSNLPALDPARTSSGQIGGPATTRPTAPATSPIKGPLNSLGTAYGETLSAMVPSPFESRTNAIRDQNREGLIAEPEKPAVPPGIPAAPKSPAAASSPVVPGSSAAGAAANEVDQPGTTTGTTPPNSGPVPYTVAPVANTNGVQRINQLGKSPLFTNIDPGQAVAEMKGNPVGGFQPASLRNDASLPAAPAAPGLGFGPGSVGEQRASGVGGNDVMGILQRENQIRAGMGELQDQINFNAGGGIGFRKRTPDEAVGDLLFSDKAASRIAALNHLSGRQDAAAKQGLDQQEMALRRQDSAAKSVTAGLSNQAQVLELQKAQRQADLQRQLAAETDPTRRNELARQLLAVQGKEERPAFSMAKVETGTDGLGNPILSTIPVNQRTGEYVFPPKAASAGSSTPPQNHIDALKKSPNQAAMFDAVYGQGAAARYLVGVK
ncbi:hypothetical protein [Zoogloea sp.]|uniref:hypothetical protein n=1 Tax=Zoogloea sp. TaxID=49181 RepID=UPI0025CDD920|nr:hypothetical protein [Zoogloea sp.]MCK6392066.1 hypothetical protein [Zoogloea sp.]